MILTHFIVLFLTSNNLAGANSDCEAENSDIINNSLKGAYRDVVKYLKYFFGKPKTVFKTTWWRPY